jgi:hypothetical protein
MKRILVTILSFLYMASAMGATVHLHYCMGEFMGASLVHKHEHKCDKCGMVKTEDDNGCCKDEHKTIKTAEHHAAKLAFDLASIEPAIIPELLIPRDVASIHSAPLQLKGAFANAPPGACRPCPIYIYVCNFRI